MPRTVARLLAESLHAHDVDQVFCVPGESYIGLTNALVWYGRLHFRLIRPAIDPQADHAAAAHVLAGQASADHTSANHSLD